LRLLQGRMKNAINQTSEGDHEQILKEIPEPPPWDPMTSESIDFEIGLIHKFLQDKLSSSTEQYIIEDENLPIKLRPAKPRLPPTGKINTPRKRKEIPTNASNSKKKKKVGKVEPAQQVSSPIGMTIIREEDGSDVESLFG
jgi:transcriptional activator SPT7